MFEVSYSNVIDRKARKNARLNPSLVIPGVPKRMLKNVRFEDVVQFKEVINLKGEHVQALYARLIKDMFALNDRKFPLLKKDRQIPKIQLATSHVRCMLWITLMAEGLNEKLLTVKREKNKVKRAKLAKELHPQQVGLRDIMRNLNFVVGFGNNAMAYSRSLLGKTVASIEKHLPAIRKASANLRDELRNELWNLILQETIDNCIANYKVMERKTR